MLEAGRYVRVFEDPDRPATLVGHGQLHRFVGILHDEEVWLVRMDEAVLDLDVICGTTMEYVGELITTKVRPEHVVRLTDVDLAGFKEALEHP